MIEPFDIMIDLETLGTGSDCHILSIGACTMDGAASFHKVLGEQDRKIDLGTVRWWMDQSKDAQFVIKQAAMSDLSLLDCLLELQDFIHASGENVRVWSHGAGFDIAILENAFRQVGLNTPWSFWNVRDTRTLIDLAKWKFGEKIEPTRDGLHHNALDDAKHQARWMCSIMSKLADEQGA
jgi:inhibitor of KinA sporulation pathway (predicted exonuclease)